LIPGQKTNSAKNLVKRSVEEIGRVPAIPAKAGIHYFQRLKNTLGSSFRWGDDFLQIHQPWMPL
jgi:hypothetical protein